MAIMALAPSKTTVYISNLPFDLKNNDLHKIFEKHGKIVKVTVLKDKVYRKSKGVAFILFLKREDAETCINATNNVEMFGRTLKASLAVDNGRSTEFIRKKTYPDKSKCYECGEEGHLSYSCDKNLLGSREPPPKKVRKRKKNKDNSMSKIESGNESDVDDSNDYVDCETLSAAIALEQERFDMEDCRQQVVSGHNNADKLPKKKKIRKSAYFSDEEESD